MPGEADIRVIAAEVVGFDISGFSAFAETWLARGDGSGVDDLARVWDRAAAPQIDRLIEAGYQIADVCGDCVAAFRSAPLDSFVAHRLLDYIERDFSAVAPALSLRTARVQGDLALIGVQSLGTDYEWASGGAIQKLHALLANGPRAQSVSTDTAWLGAARRDEALAYQWSRTGAEIRVLASLFVRLAPEPWMWSDRARITQTVHRVATCVAASSGRLEKITHDDKGLLFRCAFTDFRDDPVVAAARAGAMIVAARLADETGAAVCEGQAYCGPLRVGADQVVTAHGPAVNRAAKACANMEGLIVHAGGGAQQAARLRALGLQPDETGRTWTGAAWNAQTLAAPSRTDEPELFVGRQEVLARLLELLPLAVDGAAALVVEASAGAGKSALARQFSAMLPADWRSVTAHAAAVDGLRGPWPVLLRGLISQSFGDDGDALAAALRDEGLDETDLALLFNLGVTDTPERPDLPRIEPLALRQRIDSIFVALLRATRGKVALILEDAHWLTQEAARWLDLCHATDGERLILVTRRPEPGAVEVLVGVRRLRLSPLSAAEAHGFVRARRPDLIPQASARSTIALLARGSPLLLEHLTRAWPPPERPDFHRFGTLIGGVDARDGDVLERVLNVRLDGLRVVETDVLRRLAIETGPCRLDEVDLADQDEFVRAARRLVSLGLVQTDGAGRFAPRHALIAEAVRLRTPGLLLKVLNTRAARRLTRSASVDPAVIGAHWREARSPVRAAIWMARAAAIAEASGALRAACQLYEAALNTCPEAGHTGRAAQTWRSRLAAATFGLGELARARTEASRCGSGRRLAASRRRALLVQTEIATFTADAKTAFRSLAELRRLGGADDEGLRGREAALWGYALSLLRARPIAEALYRRAETAGPRDRYYVQASRGLAHTCFAEWEPARAALAEAIELSPPQRLPHENEIATTLLALGDYLQGRSAESLAHFDAILECSRGRENAMHEAWGLYGGAQALIALGRPHEAMARLDRAERLLEGHIDQQSQLICSGLRVALAEQSGDGPSLAAAMGANRAIVEAMPASNFGSFEGYAARPTAALRSLLGSGAASPTLSVHARNGLSALKRYAILFPVGRPRLGVCQALALAARGRQRAARNELDRARRLALRLKMPREAALAEHCLETLVT